MYRRIRDLREDSDLFQKDLAEYLQCSQVCYSHYEMGKRDIPTDVLIKLANYYLSLIHISEPTRQAEISYAVFCLKKKNLNLIHISETTRHAEITDAVFC